ncbi:MAG: ATP-binding cassette domain-containing protein [Lachnospiraceae bacterium]|nr:ATP-binding cassette domain-containing protein [Lachnospiraceae bacterium]
MLLIKLINVCKKIGEKTILDGINLEIHKGQMTFIVGTSGAGKTTLLNMIGGLDQPTNGEILFDNENIQSDLCKYRAKNIGFIFQDFNLISGLSIIENVKIATELSGVNQDREKIIEELKKVGISDPYQKVETLSGGEKQRAALVRGICKDAEILIADEPTGNLDSSNAELVLDLLQSLKEDKHIVVVSHDMEKAQKYADRIIKISDGTIVSDDSQVKTRTIVEEVKEKSKLNKTENRFFKTLSTLGKNSIRRRCSRILSIAGVIGLAIAAIATVIYLKKSGTEMSNQVNVNYLENDLVDIFYGVTPNTSAKELPLTDENLQWISDNISHKEIVEIYQINRNDDVFSNGSKAATACIKQINIDSFFEERVMSNNIEGEFLNQKNEIILAEDVAQELFDGDCLGKTVSFCDANGNAYEYTVVGINHTQSPFETYYSYVSAESLKDLREQSLKENIYQRQEVLTYYTEVQSVKIGGLYGTMKQTDFEEQLLYGTYPKDSNEIMISSGLLAETLYEFGIETNYRLEEIQQGALTETDFELISGKDMAINCNGLYKVRITGIYESDEIEIRYPEELIDEMLVPKPVEISVYVSEHENISNIENMIDEETDFSIETRLEELKENVLMQTQFMQLALITLGIILFLVSVTMLRSFSKISVIERTKEIAIIKSLGANNKKCLGVLLYDSVVISILAFLIGLIIFTIIKILIPIVAPNVDLLGDGFPFVQILGISIIFAVVIIAETAISLRKLVKNTPAKLLKK